MFFLINRLFDVFEINEIERKNFNGRSLKIYARGTSMATHIRFLTKTAT